MNFNYAILVLAFLLLVVLAVFNPSPFIFDEKLFPPNIDLMEQHGFGEKFLLEMNNQAPGPLYEFVYLPLKPLTELIPWRMRTVNILLFSLIIFLSYTFFRLQNFDSKKSSYYALHLLAIPTLWQVAGLALTEIPAMLFAALWFFIFCEQLKDLSNKRKLFITSLLCGITLALAVLGRTPYLTLLGCGVAIILVGKYPAKDLTPMIISAVIQSTIVLAIVLPVFYIWGGLVPPLQSSVEGTLKPWHSILAISYLGITGLILNISWFKIQVLNLKFIASLLIGVFLLFVLLNVFDVGVKYAPLSVTVESLLPTPLVEIYILVVSPILACFAAYFLMCCFFRVRENLQNPAFLIATCAALVLAASAAKISHQFSSRYIAQAAPFMLVMFLDRYDMNKDNTKWLRLAIGIIIGVVSLNTYAEIF
jgi:hypothetical protein